MAIVADTRVEGRVARIGEAAQPDSPQHFLVRRIRGDGVLPRALQDFGMSVVRVGDVLRPARNVHSQRNRVVLGDDEAAAAGKADLRLVGENPGARSRDVAFEPQRGFEDLVPDFDGDAGVLARRSRSPPGQEILVVDEEAAVLEHRR